MRLGLRETWRTFGRFSCMLAAGRLSVPDLADFLAFAADDTSTRQLENLRTCVRPPAACGARLVLQHSRDAIRRKKRGPQGLASVMGSRGRDVACSLDPFDGSPTRELAGFVRC